MGWYKNIIATLEEYGLPTDFSTIKSIPTLIEQMNIKRINDECHKKTDVSTTPKTKTISIIEQINAPYYERGTHDELKQLTKHEFKTIVMARFRMLQCGKNFKGTMRELCEHCNCIDDENHRLNECKKFVTTEGYPTVNFDDIYSNDITVIRNVINAIEKIWNTSNSHGTVHRHLQ